MAPRNVARAVEFFRGMRLKIVTGSWYLGGFIENGAAENSFLAGKVEGWANSVGTLVGVSRKHLQSTFSGLQKSLQQEWEFMQRVTPVIEDTLRPVEKALQETFLPSLFEGLGERAP